MEAEDNRIIIHVFHKYIILYCTEWIADISRYIYSQKNPFKVWSTSISGINKIIFYWSISNLVGVDLTSASAVASFFFSSCFFISSLALSSSVLVTETT